MTQTIYQVDAFTSKLFGGNPAAVCPLTEWLPDETMQKIAEENNLSETAFYVPEGDGFHIRWFTPTVEVELCGHATLATAFVIFEMENYPKEKITFSSMSGELTVVKSGNLLTLDFPMDATEQVEVPENIAQALGKKPIEAWKGKLDYLLIYENEADIATLTPDFKSLAECEGARLAIVSAKGDKVDFVSRVFGPQVGIDEDPVTGAAHTTMIPYWAKTLDKNVLEARQISARLGELSCEFTGERVKIAGQGKLYMKGEIFI